MTDQSKTNTQDGFDAIEYPLDYSFKAVCEKTKDIQCVVRAAVKTIVSEKEIKQVSEKESSAGRYISITIVVALNSRQELEAIYSALSACPQVRMTL